jgi:hypothetical protein
MRKTVALDDDLAERIAARARETGKSFQAALNDALRHGLGEPEFRLLPHPGKLRLCVDDHQLNELAWEVPASKQ